MLEVFFLRNQLRDMKSQRKIIKILQLKYLENHGKNGEKFCFFCNNLNLECNFHLSLGSKISKRSFLLENFAEINRNIAKVADISRYRRFFSIFNRNRISFNRNLKIRVVIIALFRKFELSRKLSLHNLDRYCFVQI